jgi:hypothetical protein
MGGGLMQGRYFLPDLSQLINVCTNALRTDYKTSTENQVHRLYKVPYKVRKCDETFKGTVSRDFLLHFFSSIIFPQAPENNSRVI